MKILAKKYYQVDSFDAKKTARIMAKNLPVSLKYSVELLREMKGQRVDKMEKFLLRVVEMKDFLPLRKYNRKIGHKKGEAKSFTKSGKYPIRLAKVFLKLLGNLKANADYKGLNAENLLIVHGFASEGSRRYSGQPQGRISGKRRRKKACHVELIALEAS